jgi:signal peptidase I
MTGSSMSPTIEDGQYIISNSLLEPETGAIIIYKDRGGQNMITRIIAEENDTVKIADGRVYVNGEGITEDYLSTEVETKEGRFIEENIEYQVPENSFFILGDNRMNSRDSREFGFVDSENIISVFWFSF